MYIGPAGAGGNPAWRAGYQPGRNAGFMTDTGRRIQSPPEDGKQGGSRARREANRMFAVLRNGGRTLAAGLPESRLFEELSGAVLVVTRQRKRQRTGMLERLNDAGVPVGYVEE